MDDVIDGLTDLGFDVLEGGLRVAAENEIGKAAERLCRGVRMDGRERSGVAGVEGIEQRARLDSAHLAQDDPVGTPAQRGLQQIVESDAGLEGIGLALDGQHVRLLQMQLRSILDDDDALVVGNCLARVRSTVVFPVEVPPLMRIVFPLRICAARNSASGRVSVPRAIRSSTV